MNSINIEDVKISYLGHSGFIIEKGPHKIVIDPFLTGNHLATKKPEEIETTQIILTHGHSDHVGDAIEIAKRNDCNITAVFELAKWCEEQGVKSTTGMPIGGRYKFDWGTVHLRTAMHSGFTKDEKYFGIAASLLFDFGNFKFYHLGDTALISDFKLVSEIYKPEIIAVPIGGRFTMNIDEAVVATKWLNAKKVIPIHYNTFPFITADPEEFKRKVEKETKTECIILKP